MNKSRPLFVFLISFLVLILPSLSATPSEMRGIWISDPTDFKWKKVIKNLKKAGINNLFINFASAGVAFYKSAYLPSKPLDEPYEELIRLAHENGIKVHAKILCFFMHWAPDDHIEKMIRDKRVLINTMGKVAYQSQTPWLDPGQHENRELIKSVIQEIIRKFDVDGIQLDYVRFFEEWNVPETIMRIRRVTVTNFVIETSQMVRQLKPSLAYSACIFYNPKRACEEMAQDWITWDAKNVFDFLVPMNYTTYPKEIIKWIDCQKFVHKGDTLFYSGLGAYMPSMTPTKLFKEIDFVKQCGYSGFVLFAYNEDFEKRMLPDLIQRYNPPAGGASKKKSGVKNGKKSKGSAKPQASQI